MIVANNLNALSTRRNLNLNNTSMSGSLERLSSGYRINSGKDDPSGLVISEQLRAQNAGLQRAVQNTQEANNVLGIAEGALNEMNSILKKMRQLAIHSANNGVTSPEQIAADQAEVDSSVQTIDRIARTTKYSDQFLLNGNKELGYESSTLITDSQDMKLLDDELTDIRQIFKRDDFKLNINFSGAGTDANGNNIDNGNEAQKGYFEISRAQSAATQVNSDGELTQDQAFTLTGNDGSRYLSFAKGTHLGEMVTSINSVSDSTGVKATLVFDSDTTVSGATTGTSSVSTNGVVAAGVTELGSTFTHSSGTADAFNRNSLGEITTTGVTALSVASTNGIKLGENVDGFGRAYLKMVDDDSYEIYKDESMTMKVGEGDVTATGGTTIISANNSGLSGLSLTFSSSGLQAGSTTMIQLGVLHEDVISGGSSSTATKTFSGLPNAVADNMYQDGGTGLPALDLVDIFTVTSGEFPTAMAGNTYGIWGTTPGNYSLVDGGLNVLAAEISSSFDAAANTFSVAFNYLGGTFEITGHINGVAMDAAGPTFIDAHFAVPADYTASTSTPGTSSAKDGIDMSDFVDDTSVGTNGGFVLDGSFLSGVKLGENTSDTGKLYLKADLNAIGTSQVWAYKDARMRDEDLVAESDEVDLTGSSGGSVRLYGTTIGDSSATSGLYGTLNFDQILTDVDVASSEIEFTNLAMRISADEYGSDQFVTVDADEGALFTHYTETDGAVLMDAGLTGTSWTEYGRDAAVSINGQEVKLDGTSGEVANLDTQATLAFNEGTLGNTTLATVGYETGSWGSRASMIDKDEGNAITHALHSTTEVLSDFRGGMQFQLGEGSGDQERTIFSVSSATATELGRVKFHDEFDGNMKSDKYLSLNDMLSGGWASLSTDAVKALEIIDQAIEDVSNLRSQIGAFQSNMLETNANSLNVAIENITKTESYIRDADMASESTDFSRNQIMVQAGTSMLAQANQNQQSVLSLLG